MVSTSRFKTLLVKKKTKISIKSFVEEKKLKFKKGRGFYQLTKPEIIQDYKEVIVRRKSDGVFLTGDKVKEVLNIPKTSKKFKLDLDEITDFDVFVQSTSVNRVLLPDTEFLYEVDDDVSYLAIEILYTYTYTVVCHRSIEVSSMQLGTWVNYMLSDLECPASMKGLC